MASTDPVLRTPPEMLTLTGLQQAPLGLLRQTPQQLVDYSAANVRLQPGMMADPRGISMLELLKLRGNGGIQSHFNG